MNSKVEDVINPFVRGAAAGIDLFIAGFFRVVFVQIAGSYWVNDKMIEFYTEFAEKFNEPFSGTNEVHIIFLASHSIVQVMITFLVLTILVGALYHAYFNSSTWSATIGKRLFNLILVKNEGKPLNFFQALGHYFLSLVPWVFMFYILLYQAKNGLGLHEAITSSIVNIVLGLLTVAWIQFHILTKKKTTVQDAVIGCTMVKGKIGNSIPKIR